MALEIERRFLVCGDGWRSHVLWQAGLCQGYLADDGHGLTVRVRLSEEPEQERAWLTLKAPQPPEQRAAKTAGAEEPPAALTRLEFEYPIPPADARGLLALAGQPISKRRYGLDLAGGDWVLDVFAGANAPLVIVEVELACAESTVEVPSWCGQEITGRHELSNAGLARRPLASWSEAERRLLLGPPAG